MTDKNFTLTQERLKEVLHYNPETGIFTRRIRTSNSVHVGDVAGTIKRCAGKRYISIRVNSKKHSAHRLAVLYMTGKFPDDQVDHDDGNGLNNKWLNLNEVTGLQNSKNQRKRSTNTTGCMGVCWVKQEEAWRSRINVNNVSSYLGYFTDFFEACCARKSAENKYGFHPNHGTIRPL